MSNSNSRFRSYLVFAGILLTMQMSLRLAMSHSRTARALFQGRPLTFTMPTDVERLAAIGDLSDVPLAERSLFEPAGFQPLAEPGPNDWLTANPEYPQTFDDFVKSNPLRPDAERHTVYLLPLSDWDESLPRLESLGDFMSAWFGLPVRVLPSVLISPDEFRPRIHPGTQQLQLHTVPLLDWLETTLPDDAFCVLAITRADLYPADDWSFVLGQASDRRVGVYSLARFDPEFFGEKRPANFEQQFRDRCYRLLAHEASHIFGLLHCVHFECVMNGANSLEESDEMPLKLCPVCLHKLVSSTRCSLVEREAALRPFLDESASPATTSSETD